MLVLGASGLLGNAMMQVLPESGSLEVYGTIRSDASRALFAQTLSAHLVTLPDVFDDEAVATLFRHVQPDVVINCISPSREALVAGDPLEVIPTCAVLPHRLAAQCARSNARLIHMSTDGVFSGSRGDYCEHDEPDARDIYGLSKYLGEVRQPHAVTIRTSMIGHELRSRQGLLEWFLSQNGHCTCYGRAVFSGLPAVVLAEVVRDTIIPHPDLTGVYHVAAQPITKCDLLRLIAQVYGKSIEIVPADNVVIDRSLNSRRFCDATGYAAPDWPTMIQIMHSYRQRGMALV
jgi:dTDP-4-dehydrorhamnose reductase